MRDSGLRGGSRLRLKAALHRRLKLRGIPSEIHGYSLARILLFGLILPAIVTLCMVVGMVSAFLLNFSLPMKFLTLASSTLVGFLLGTLTLLRLTGRMLKFAKIRKEGE